MRGEADPEGFPSAFASQRILFSFWVSLDGDIPAATNNALTPKTKVDRFIFPC